ncbi:MAG: hypothetical protein ACE1Y4_14120 [Lysobacterales bacterium]
MKPQIAFLGTGIMGAPMCAHGRSQLDHSALYLELADRRKDS